MNTPGSLFRNLLILCLALLLAACGGGGGGGPAPSGASISGLAATGAGIANATVTARCAAGPVITGTTSSGGAFTLTLAVNNALPCMLQVTGGTPAVTLHSFAMAEGTVNITPATELILARALGANPADVFARFDAAIGETLNSGIAAATAYIVEEIEVMTGGAFTVNPMSDAFAIGDYNDLILDAIAFALTREGKALGDLIAAAAAGTPLSNVVPPGWMTGNASPPQVVALPFGATPRPVNPTIKPYWVGPTSVNKLALMDDGSTVMFDSYGYAGALDPFPTPLKMLRFDSAGTVVASLYIADGIATSLPQVQADNIGGAFIAWTHSTFDGSDYYRRLYVRRYDRVTGLGETSTIIGDIGGQIEDFRLSVRPDGTAVIAFVYRFQTPAPLGGYQRAVMTVEYGPTGWSLASQVSSTLTSEIPQLTLATSPNGKTLVLWTQQTGTGIGSGAAEQMVYGKIVASYKDRDGQFSAPAVVEVDGTSAENSLRFPYLETALSDAGNAMVVWQRGTAGAGYSRFEAANGWLGTGVISDTGTLPSVAMNSNGQGLVAWIEPAMKRAFAARFNEADWQGDSVELTSPRNEIWPGEKAPRLFVDSGGNAVALFKACANCYGLMGGKPAAIGARQYSVQTGWQKDIVFAPANETSLLFFESGVANGKASIIWETGNSIDGLGVPMLLTFPIARP